MFSRDVQHERPAVCLATLRVVLVAAGRCALVLLAVSLVGWCALPQVIADDASGANERSKISVSAEAVVPTRTNPFAIPVANHRQATPRASQPLATPSNPPSNLRGNPPSNPRGRPQRLGASTAGQRPSAAASPRNTPNIQGTANTQGTTNHRPATTSPAKAVSEPFVLPNGAISQGARQPAIVLPPLPAAPKRTGTPTVSATSTTPDRIHPKRLAIPTRTPQIGSLQVQPVATKSQPYAVDSMSLGDEAQEQLRYALPDSAQAATPAYSLTAPSYSLAAPETTNASPVSTSPVSTGPVAASAVPASTMSASTMSASAVAASTMSASSVPSYASAPYSNSPQAATARSETSSSGEPQPTGITQTLPTSDATRAVVDTDTRAGNSLHTPNPQQIPGPLSHGMMGRYLDPYRVRASETVQDEVIDIVDPRALFAESESAHSMPAATGGNGFEMWWEPEMATAIGFTERSLQVDVGSLTQTALASSPFVRALLTKPHLRRSDIVIADSEFDPTVYLEGRFTDTNDPVGSALTTGDNSDRFRDETFTSNGGVRKKTRGGAELELAQRGGFQSNNSTFLDPNPQGTTRLEFNFTQPLMRDRGQPVNNIRVLLAQLDLQIDTAEVRNDLENHLIDVTRSYWELYQSRAQWLQRKRLLDEALRLHQILQARSGVDSHQRQVLRARAAVASRKSDLVRITTRIRDAQSRLRLLTGSPQLIQSGPVELTPQDQPLEFPVAISTRQSVITALDNRADLASALRRIQAVSARVGVARNQVLPRLDLLLGTYVSGLDDNRNTFGAWANQFSEGRPTYWAGLTYELPVGNRASRARLTRNRWEMSQVMNEFQQTTELAFTEVEVAVRETQTAYNLMVAKDQAIRAAANEVRFLQQRWELLPDPNESAVLLIEDLLEAQERLADEEQAFVAAQVAYAMSWIQLRKVMGVLLRFDANDGQPEIISETEETSRGDETILDTPPSPTIVPDASVSAPISLGAPSGATFDPMQLEDVSESNGFSFGESFP